MLPVYKLSVLGLCGTYLYSRYILFHSPTTNIPAPPPHTFQTHSISVRVYGNLFHHCHYSPLVHFKPHTIRVLMFGYLTAVFYWAILSNYTYALVFNNSFLLIKIYTRYHWISPCVFQYISHLFFTFLSVVTPRFPLDMKCACLYLTTSVPYLS